MTIRNAGRRSPTSVSWYEIRNAAGTNNAPAEIWIYDEIGFWGISAALFIQELSTVTADKILLRISSPGGEIFDGIAIFNVLRSMDAHLTVQVDGIAASIASVIAMAGDTINMMPNSQMMIHNAQGACMGEASDMLAMADLLKRQSENIADVYNTRAGGGVKTWLARMDAETWITAQEAVTMGLADSVVKVTRQDPLPDNRWADRFAAKFDVKRMAASLTAVAAPDDDDTHEVVDAENDTCPDCGQEIPDGQTLAEHQANDCPSNAEEDAAEPFEVPEYAPAVFAAALRAAADDDFHFDPQSFRETMETLTSEASAVPARPAQDPEPAEEAPAEEPEEAPSIGAYMAQLLANLAADAPAEPERRAVEPPPPPAPQAPVNQEPAPDPWSVVAEVMATAISMEANNRPAPTAPAKEPEPEPDHYDSHRLATALREATR